MLPVRRPPCRAAPSSPRTREFSNEPNPPTSSFFLLVLNEPADLEHVLAEDERVVVLEDVEVLVVVERRLVPERLSSRRRPRTPDDLRRPAYSWPLLGKIDGISALICAVQLRVGAAARHGDLVGRIGELQAC